MTPSLRSGAGQLAALQEAGRAAGLLLSEAVLSAELLHNERSEWSRGERERAVLHPREARVSG